MDEDKIQLELQVAKKHFLKILKRIETFSPELYKEIEKRASYPDQDKYPNQNKYDDKVDTAELEALFDLIKEMRR